jgi:flagellar hook-associated protein 3 FlgL
MTRVATSQQSQVMVQRMMNSQSKVIDAQRQVNTGKVAETYKDIYQDTTSLAGAKSLLARLEQHKQNAGIIQTGLQSYDQTIGAMETAATDLRDAAMGALNASSALGFQASVQGVFDNMVGLMNSKDTEGFLYSGSKKDTAPINITAMNDLLTALEPPTDIFANDSLKRSVRIDENRVLETGILANEIGLEIMTAIQRITLWQNGTLPTTAPVPAGPAGPVTTPLRPEDQAFLTGEIANLEKLVKDFAQVRGENGLNQKTVQDTQTSLITQVDQAKLFISNIEDVDAAVAITNLNQANFALEASYNVLSQINQLSLLRYI